MGMGMGMGMCEREWIPGRVRRSNLSPRWLVLVLGVGLVAACRKETVTPPPTPVGSSGMASGGAAVATTVGAAGTAAAGTRVVVQVTEAGFVPATIAGEVGKPLTLVVTRTTDRTCARELVITGLPGKTELPLDRPVEVTYTPTAAGHVPFGCAMGMMVSGALEIH